MQWYPPSCLLTYSFACWVWNLMAWICHPILYADLFLRLSGQSPPTNLNFLRISHGCCLTWSSSSLCRRIFSNICSCVAASPSMLIAVLIYNLKKCLYMRKVFCGLKFISLNRKIRSTHSPELVVKTDERRRSLSKGEEVLLLPPFTFRMDVRRWRMAVIEAE